MKRLAGLVAAALIVAGSGLASSPTSAASAQSKTSENRYIVTLKDGANPRAVASIAGIVPTHVYDAALNGFAAELNQGQLTALQRQPSVASIEADQTIAIGSLNDSAQSSQLSPAADSTINSAANVSAYVIDTGIYTSLPEFGGRAINVYDAFGGTGQDCHGHGTYMSSVLGGTVYGVAKDVKLRGVRVLNCTGSGTISGIISGVNYVASNAIRPALANMSFTSSASTTLDSAATNVVNRGIPFIAAAGDNNANACNYSPGRVASVITVGASTATNTRAPYSNYGSCVDIYALGTRTATGPGGTMTVSGTGVAAAYVSGCVAKYLGLNPTATPAQIANWLIANSQTFNGIRIFTCPI